MNVKIRKLHEYAAVPEYATQLSAGFDLVATEDVIIAPGETALIPTGLAFEIPEGHEMQIRPRSGITKNTKLRVGNAPGTCDADFRGEVKVIIDNIAQLRYSGTISVRVDTCRNYKTLDGGSVVTEDTRHYRNAYADDNHYDMYPREVPVGTYIIRKGDRIAQGIITPIIRATFEVVEELTETERGSGGFGSTSIR
jgi:dUTP pyrophosphatase